MVNLMILHSVSVSYEPFIIWSLPQSTYQYMFFISVVIHINICSSYQLLLLFLAKQESYTVTSCDMKFTDNMKFTVNMKFKDNAHEKHHHWVFWIKDHYFNLQDLPKRISQTKHYWKKEMLLLVLS